MPTLIPLTERNLWGSIKCSRMHRRETPIEPTFADAAEAAEASSSGHRLPKASSKPKGKKIDAANFFGNKAKSSAKSKKVDKAATKAATKPDSKPQVAKKKLNRTIESDDDDDDDADSRGQPKDGKAEDPPAPSDPAPKAAIASKGEEIPPAAKPTAKPAAAKPTAKPAAAKEAATAEAPAAPASPEKKKKAAKRKADEPEEKSASKSEKRKSKAADPTDDGSPKKRKKIVVDTEEVAPGPNIAGESGDPACGHCDVHPWALACLPRRVCVCISTDALGGVKTTRKITRKEQRTFMNEKGYMGVLPTTNCPACEARESCSRPRLQHHCSLPTLRPASRFTVTEMVEVEEEIEVDAEAHASPKKPAPAKKETSGGGKDPTKKKKQASMMSFFTKKKPDK